MSITEVTCAYCHQPVKLENAKTNENGQAVHEDCYVANSLSVEEPNLDRTWIGSRKTNGETSGDRS